MLISSLKSKIKTLFIPRSISEDDKRQEFIFSVLSLSSIAFLILINLIRIADFIVATINQRHDRGLPLIITLIILGLFIFIFWLSRHHGRKIARFLFLAMYFIPALYFAWYWGADLPSALLLTVLAIAMSGVLVSARFALTSAAISGGILLLITHLHSANIIKAHSYWRQESHNLGDMLSYSIIIGVTAAVVWLYATEIKKSLTRARISEANLKQERDLLEIKVIERTQEIRALEMEKISQLYRLAEFGRLSSGIFHDLISPLTALALNLEQLKQSAPALQAYSYLDQAFVATRKMEKFIDGLKKQVQGVSTKNYFSLEEESLASLKLLNYKLQKAKINLETKLSPGLTIYGDALKFNQVITNLIANAIDACEEKNFSNYCGHIKFFLSSNDQQIIITIEDNGIGIDESNLDKIWQTFFSTKSAEGRGLGIGLASTKNIIEKDFGGTINVSSQKNLGTKFTVIIPCQKSDKNYEPKENNS